MDIGPDALGHISACRACSEARVLWLAQGDIDMDHGRQAPAGYFGALPGRVLRKLPPQHARRRRGTPLLAAAASLAMLAAMGAGGYLLGRHDQAPQAFLEAVHAPRAFQDISSDPTSFSSLELFSQIPDLTPEEINALMMDLKNPEAGVQPAKMEDY
jgi:hypothetical protein